MDDEQLRRQRVSEALKNQLDAGQAFTSAEADLDPDQVLSWGTRLRALSVELADTLRAPRRNAVISILQHPSVEDDEDALRLLRYNVIGMSDRALAEEIGVSSPTISRLQRGEGCSPPTAKKIADLFALRVAELFVDDDGGKGLLVRDVGGLREQLELD